MIARISLMWIACNVTIIIIDNLIVRESANVDLVTIKMEWRLNAVNVVICVMNVNMEIHLITVFPVIKMLQNDFFFSINVSANKDSLN